LRRRRTLERLFADWPAKIISVSAAILLFLFYRINTMEERVFTTALKADPPPGLAISKPYPRSARITLRGREENIFSVLEDDLAAEADFEAVRGEGQYRVPIRVVRKGASVNIEPLEIRVEPAEISVTLEEEVQRSLDVQPRLTGIPAPGFELVQYSVTPNRVQVSGPRSIVSDLTEVQTDTIDLTGRSEDFTVEVGILRENPLVIYPREMTAAFRGIIREAVVIKTFENVDIITLDLSAGLRIAASLPKGSIRVQGGQLALEDLSPARFRLVVDCSEVATAGTVTLPTAPDVPPDFVILKYEPRELTLNFIPVNLEDSTP
jgi:YbbR domain-containing protein